jgi:hypothetical protein
MMVLQQIKHYEDNKLPTSCCKLCDGSTFMFVSNFVFFLNLIYASSSRDG